MDQISGALPVLKVPNSKNYVQLPYKPSTTPELIAKRFKMHEVPKYDGTSDPQEHITTYTTAVKGNDLVPHEIESVLLRKFGETLTRGALTWYSLLPEHPIDSFKVLADSFIKAHAGARKKERILLPAVPDECAAEAFAKGLNSRSSGTSRKLKESMLEFQAMTWADVHNRYELKIRIEDDQVGFPSSTKVREKNKEKMKDDIDTNRRTSRGCFLPYERTKGRGRNFRTTDRFTVDRMTDRGQKNKLLQDREVSGSRDSSYPKLSEYNFNLSVVELVSVVRSIKEARFPRPMKSDPSQRDPNLWCEYHGTNDHRTRDCRHLREEVATLLKNGHLREFLSDRAKNNYGGNKVRKPRKREKNLHAKRST
uniref:Retrotransposon gag domain-containing protein n=1 Tax=Nicotiana tabacum TaxID=4097 RepID=A0A1S3XSX9_TOBAC|nr:PREDICTED: uncharacterized protein LOC107768436 [Nicotiana tabacum]